MESFIKKVPSEDLQPDMITATPVKTPSGQTILAAGTPLTLALIARIRFYNIPSIDITSVPQPAKKIAPAPAEAPVFKNISTEKKTTLLKQTDKIVVPDNIGGVSHPTYSQQVKRSATFFSFEKNFAVSLGEIRQYFANVVDESISIDTTAIVSSMNNLARQCRTSVEFFDMLHNMRQNNDSIYAHCLNVALISRQMGIWLRLPKADIETLTVAGLFHDIGKLKLPEELLNKKEKLTDAEFMKIRQHPQYGYDILKKQNIDSRIKKAALQHHERCDGSGYPLGLVAEELEDFSRIIAIADVYDAMTAARAYRSPLCPFQVIAEFEQDGLQKYSPHYILTFLQQIAKTYQNNRVLLSNGVSANIVFLNQNHLSKPVVQLNDGTCIDLSSSDLYIKAII